MKRVSGCAKADENDVQQWLQDDTEQDILSNAEIIAAITVNEEMSEKDEDIDIEDSTMQVPKISHSEGLKAVETTFQYVYGKKVKGLVTFRFGVQGETPEAVMFGLMGPEQLDEGSHILRLPTSEIKQHKDIGWFPEIEGSHLIVEATVVDDATGKKEKAYSSKAIFSKSPFVISFKRSLRDFKPGLVSILEANVNFVDGKPASGILTKITAKVNGEVLKIKHDTAVSDDEGKVSFKLQPEMHHEIVSITVETIDPKYNGSQAVGHHEQYKFKSNNNAYLALERSSGQKLKPGDGFLKLVHIHPPEISDIYYVVVSKGQIISMNKLPPGKFLLHKVEFDITYDMVPSFRLVVFAHYNDELIADSLQIDVQHVCHPEAEVIHGFLNLDL
ncbi:complement C4-B-like [Stegodyphus dumicola]|uniref:complement C4-B-like n=1 Tax=Stegodyphus dumicola TaxID=202533 RepID=UPI0015AA385B|nr:complement C4-B-like [Stegodyphus dumicola]